MAQIENTSSIEIGDSNSNCGNIAHSFNTTIYKSDEDAKILHWLSPLEPGNRHDEVRTNRFEGVGDWLLETTKFREWRGGEDGADKAILFCSGNPGVGKTYLSSLVIDRVCNQARVEDLTVAWLYYDYLAQQEQTVINMMGAILKQLVGRREIPKDIREAFEEGRRPLLPDLVRMLRIAIASLSRVFICIDGLDECLPRNLPELFESLRDIVQESPKTRIFLTGRPHIKETVQRYFTKAVAIPISPRQEDVRNYVEMRLDRDEEPEAMNKDLRADIVEMILDKMSDMFLLVSLNIEAVLGGVTISQRRKRLQERARGNGLGDAYTATITRLKTQKGDRPRLGLQALMWVLCSKRLLRAEELCQALGVEIESSELDPENIPALRTVLASCMGLLTVETSSSTVRLVHFTLQEHLTSDPLFPSSHSTIAEVCLTYLNFGSVRDLSPPLDSAFSTMPFLEYACFYWGMHAKLGMTKKVKILRWRVFSSTTEYTSWPVVRDLGISRGVVREALTAISDAILDMNIMSVMEEADVNSTDPAGSTSLLEVVMNEQVMEEKILFQELFNNRHKIAKDGWMALFYAILMGCETLVQALLERGDVDLNQSYPRCDWTLLSLAVRLGREGIVKMFLEREGVNLNQPHSDNGHTPFSWAATMGRAGIMKLFLEREDFNPNQPNSKDGLTPLLVAAFMGDEGVAKMLLEREDIDPNQSVTECGHTPLLFAAGKGHEGIVRALLERGDVNPNHTGKDGETPLLLAAEKGHEGVVKMLLEREDVNPNQSVAGCGRTPLWFAVMEGHEGVVKMLLERGDVNPDQPSTNHGRTPLWLAAKLGHEGIVKILLERGDVNPNYAGKDGYTPLLLAAMNGHVGAVKLLLEREDANPNQPDTRYGQRPLSWAAEKGHEGIVRMFLEREDANPDQPDARYGQTPLSWAAAKGNERVVKMLLERKDVNPNQPDTTYGQTPILWAAQHGHDGVVKMLLEREDVIPDQPDTKYGLTPFSWAAQNGHVGIVMIFLEPGMSALLDNKNQSPLSNPDFSHFNSQSQSPLVAHDEEAMELDPVFATGQSVRPEGRTRTDYES